MRSGRRWYSAMADTERALATIAALGSLATRVARPSGFVACRGCVPGRKMTSDGQQRLARAEKNGLDEVVGYVLAENRAMLSLARAFGFRNVGQDLHLLELRRSVAPRS